MHAIRQHVLGGPEVLRYEELPDPEPVDGQVRIAVDAAGVHLLDTMLRAGRGGDHVPRPDLPMTPGREVAGRVDALGPGADPAWEGRRVVAHLGTASGGYAERAVVASDALHEVADHVDAATAVAMIGTGRTAMAILDLAALTPDDVVLVTAAAGGLGTLLVQAARAAGAAVAGVAGGDAKVARVAALGAGVALDYRRPDWPAAVRAGLGRPVTVLLDGVGGDIARAAVDLVGDGGRLVLFGWSSGEGVTPDEDVVAARGLGLAPPLGPHVMGRPGAKRRFETEALAAATDGRFRDAVGATFPLADAAAAHRALEERATTGKVVLLP